MSRLNSKSSVEEQVDKLRSILEKKSYLVVLDDVWRKEALEEILPALPLGNNNNGSKIIITTRNQEVVQFQNLQRHLYVHEPQPLNTKESWELFCKIAFNYRTNCNDESYEDLGKDMLEKCDGLPLAIVALAGILNTKGSIREWQQVSEAVRSKVMEGTCTHMYGKVGEMLGLSYDDLPCDLKPCFLHLGVFPEDCRIPAGMLTRMWIAEGFVAASEEMSLEDVAMQYLVELSHRFMIQVVRTNFNGAIKEIHLHDLSRELCIKKSREQSFLQINPPVHNLTANDASKIAIQTRRAALHSSTSFPTQASNLRSLVLSTMMHSGYVSNEMVDLGFIHHFKLLRLLNLWVIKTSTGALPKQIGNLIHLRYLGIRGSNINKLPKTIGNLRNLLTLDYRNIDSDHSVIIPNVLCKLTQLRHLFLPVECPWTLEELKLSTLKNLQILWGVRYLRREGFSSDMLELSTTLKKLKVVVSTGEDLEAAFSCPSLICDQLHTFHCEWTENLVLRVNHVFSNNLHLHKLVLVGKIQVEKLSSILPSNLLILELKDSDLMEDPMVVAGALTHLKLLRLSAAYIGQTLTCNLGSFPRLEELYLENLQNLGTWKIEKGAFSGLKNLEILSCRRLQDFPQGLAFVTTLQNLDFYGVPDVFVKQAATYGWSTNRLKLPHNFESLIGQSNAPIDISSIQKLLEQLTTGIFLNNNNKFWIVKQKDRQYNCFMVYVTDLFLSTTRDVDGLPDCYSEFYSSDLSCPNEDTSMQDWEWIETEESRANPLIKIAKLKSEVLVLDVCGRFDTDNLSLNVVYTFSLVFKLEDSKKAEELYVKTRLNFPDSRDSISSIPEHRHILTDQPRNEWLEVLIGEFETRPSNVGMVEFFLHCQWQQYTKIGISIKGVIIEPKW